MSNLPPPPPNAAPYAPPPAHSASQYPPAYPQYQGHDQYQQPAPTPAQAPLRGGWSGSNGYGQHSSPPRGPPNGAPKSRMQVTRYPPPPGRPQHQAPPYPGHYQQPPPVYPPSVNWGAPQPYAPPPANYPPPPQAAPYPNAPPSYPPPPQQPPQQSPFAPPHQSPYAGYPPQPPPHVVPAPPPHTGYQQPYAPTTNHQAPPAWGPPQAQPPAQQGWGSSPPSASHPPLAGPQPPAPTLVSTAASLPPPNYAPPVKDFKDPTFYDGWDDNDYEWGGALWPKASEVIDERFSLGQYIWHPPQRVSVAVSLSIDEELHEVPRAKADEPPPKVDFSVSKYWKSESNSEGDEFVFNFQRIRYIDEWEAIKDDPIFIRYPENDPPQPVPVQTILPEVFKRDREMKVTHPREDVMDSLEKTLEMYIPNSNTTAGAQAASRHPDAALHSSKQEALLASLGVSGVPKPVYSTPFPAYAPVTEDPLFGRPPLQRTISTSSVPPNRPPPPPAPAPAPPRAFSPHQRPPTTQRHPPAKEWKDPEDPWKIINEFNATNPTPNNRPTTPIGSDFGDPPLRTYRSSPEKSMGDENGGPAESKKRKADEPDTLHRKRSKARIVSDAYQRRW